MKHQFVQHPKKKRKTQGYKQNNAYFCTFNGIKHLTHE